MNKTVKTNKNQMKPKLLHLSEDVIRLFSIKAANEGTSAKILMQDTLAKVAEQIKSEIIISGGLNRN